MQGVIKRKVTERGFGFLREDQGSTEYFFHHTGCLTSFEDLQEGSRVCFEIETAKSGKGPRAYQVQAIQ